MHVGAVLVFEAGPLGLRHGGIDIERVRAYTAARLARAQRAQQRSVGLALGRLPAWVDDPFFELAYHLRHVALPRPGDERQLKRLASRSFSQALDREKPPWEIVVVEGLDEGRFALIAKADVALLEGRDGFDPLALLLSATPDEPIETVKRGETQPTPGRVALLRAELARRAREAARVEAVGATLGHGLRGALNALERAVASRGELPLTGTTGPHRRVEWLALDHADVRATGERLGASTQGLLLATLAGALRAFLSRRGLDPAELDVRALTPIGVGDEAGAVDAALVALPLAEPDPKLRLEALADRPEPAASAPGEFSLLRKLARLNEAAASGRPASLCVSSLSAPPAPRFLLGAKLRECFTFAPLLPGHTLGLSATFFDGRVMLGWSADATLVADLPLLADAVAASFDELRRIASRPVHPARKRADQSRVRNLGAEA
ncbi:MAG: wax ester/triacylglycerol synthase domain-containing protein [Myxococcota bacterium]